MNTLKTTVTILALTTLGACNEYTAEMCTRANRADVPGLEGSHKMNTYLGESSGFNVDSAKFEVKRVDVGRYTLGGDERVRREMVAYEVSQLFSTCQVGGRFIGEWYRDDVKTYFAEAIHVTDKVYETNSLAFSKDELDAGGIPYKIIERKDEHPEGGLGLIRMRHAMAGQRDEDTYKVLVVDTAALSDATTAGAYLRNMTIMFRYFH